MREFIWQVLLYEQQRDHPWSSFASNPYGDRLLNSGNLYTAEVVSMLFNEIAAGAAQCQNRLELDDKYPGLDHVLIYLLLFCFNHEQSDEVARLAELPEVLLADILFRPICFFSGWTNQMKSNRILTTELYRLAVAKQTDDFLELREASEAYIEYHQRNFGD